MPVLSTLSCLLRCSRNHPASTRNTRDATARPGRSFFTTKEILDFSCFLAWRGVPGVELSPLSSALLFQGLNEANEAFPTGGFFKLPEKNIFSPSPFRRFFKHNKHQLESIVSLAPCPLEGYANRQAHNSLAAAGRDRPRSLAQLQNSKYQTYKKLSQNCLLAWSERGKEGSGVVVRGRLRGLGLGFGGIGWVSVGFGFRLFFFSPLARSCSCRCGVCAFVYPPGRAVVF